MNDDNEKKEEIAIIDESFLSDKIYSIRGEKVMLDADLAEIYGYSTKAFNQQVKNNIDKFPSNFRFQLTKKETESSRSKFFTLKKASGRGSNAKYLPYVFTEQGIYMLMTVMKGELATKQSIALIRAFYNMKNYVLENRDLIDSKTLSLLSYQVSKNADDIAKIKETMAEKGDIQKIMSNFIDPSQYKHFLIMNGEKVEADMAYESIYKKAKKSIYVIDDYIGLKTLELLRCVNDNVQITLFSDNKKNKDSLTESLLKDFRNEYPSLSIKFKKTRGKYHDRYIVLDYRTETETIYHCGASSKDAGKRITTIMLIEDPILYRPFINALRKNPELLFAKRETLDNKAKSDGSVL